MIYNDFAAGFRAKKNEIKRLNKRIAELEKELATSKPPPNLVWFERSDVLGLDQQQTGVIDLSKFALKQQAKGVSQVQILLRGNDWEDDELQLTLASRSIELNIKAKALKEQG